MLIGRTARSLGLTLFGAAATLLGMASCGGLGAGDHVFYRITMSDAARSEGCFNNNVIPDDVKDDTSTIGDGSTWLLYINADETAELDMGSGVLSGAVTDTGYKVSGQRVNVEYNGGGTTRKITTTTKATINLKIDGATVTGDSTVVTTVQCEGTDCPADLSRSCTEKSSFNGVEVDDAEIVVSNGQP
jgi:hypothetical protein